MKIYVRSAYYDIGEYDSKDLISNISELPQGSIIYVLNSLAYDVEINDIYVCVMIFQMLKDYLWKILEAELFLISDLITPGILLRCLDTLPQNQSKKN